MRVLLFAEDNPHAALWFALLHQTFSLATPGPRDAQILSLECAVLDALDAISEPAGDPHPNGFQPRRLREPCTLPLSTSECRLLASYLTRGSFQPYLSRAVKDLLAAVFESTEISDRTE